MSVTSDNAGQAREPRNSMSGLLHYTCDEGHDGTGQWLDVSRVGACVLLGRYLKPGREVRIRFASPLVTGDELEATARVMWCEQVQRGPEFIVGLRIRRDTPEMALDFATLGYAARRTVNNTRTTMVETAAKPRVYGWMQPAMQQQPAALALAQAV